MKNKWISLRRLKAHEFRTTSRIIFRGNDTWRRRYEALAELEGRALRQFIKLCGNLTISYLTLTSLRSGNLLKLKIEAFEVSVPVAYFLTVTSLLLLISCMAFCHLSTAMSLRIREGSKIRIVGFSANMYGLLTGKSDNFALSVPISNSYFLKERIPFGNIFSLLIFVALLSSLLPLGAFGSFLFMEQLNSMFDPNTTVYEKVVVFIGLFITAVSFLFVLIFHMPLPTEKNLNLLRWGFLWRLSPGFHPKAESWLATKRK